MRIAAALATTFLLCLQAGFALDKGAILKLAKKPHSRANLVPELALFADGREFAVDYEMQPTGAPPIKINYTVKDKVVDGRYLVSIFRPPGAPNNIYMVVSYDRQAGVYRKSVFIPDGKKGTVYEMSGTTANDKRTITWVNKTGPDSRIETVEKHSPSGMTWTEVHFMEGKVIARATGTARKTK